MQTLLRILLFVILCWCGYHAVRQTFEACTPGILPYLFFILTIALTIVAAVLDFKAYRLLRKTYQFYRSGTGLFICIIVVLRLVSFYNIDRSAVLYTAFKRQGKNIIVEIQFKEKNYLVIQDLSTPVVHTYYGRYRSNKDSVFITQTNYERFAKALPFYGVVKDGLVIWKNGDTMTSFPTRPRL